MDLRASKFNVVVIATDVETVRHELLVLVNRRVTYKQLSDQHFVHQSRLLID